MTDDGNYQWNQRAFVSEMLQIWNSRRHPRTDSGDIEAMDMIVTRAILFGREHDRLHRPPETEKPRRVPVQVSLCESETWAAMAIIANDGTMWRATTGSEWVRLPDIPQD